MNALGKAIAMLLLGMVALSMLGTYLFSRPNNPDTYYDVLGLSTVQSTNKEIRVQYRSMVKKLHPDYRRQLSAEEQARTARYTIEQVNQAYKVLSNPKQRIRYDYTLGSPGNFHQEVYTLSLTDRVPRCYEYNGAWDGPGYRQLFGNIDQILIGYEMRFPQWAKMAREIYTKSAEGVDMDEADIKPYVLEKSKGYDNVVTYHFSDWQDQLDRPKQNLINLGSIVFSIVAAVVPIWFVCGGEKKEEVDLSGLVLDEEGNVVDMTLEEYQKAGWTPEQIKAHKQAQKEKADIDRMNRIMELDEKDRVRELNKLNRQIQEEKKRDKIIEAIKKKQKSLPPSPYNTNTNTTTTTTTTAPTATKPESPSPRDEISPTSSVEVATTAAKENQQFFCQPCKKGYQSEPQYEQHIKSSKHIKTVKDLEKKKK